MNQKRAVIILFYTLILVHSFAIAQVDALTQTLTVDDQDIHIEIFPAHTPQTKNILVWIPSETGFQAEQKAMARRLNSMGYEVWFPNLLEDLFLPVVSSSLSRIPASIVAAVLHSAYKKSAQPVYLIAEGDGVVPALRGAWRQVQTQSFKIGLILLSGKFLLETPEPGESPKRYPVVHEAALPVFLIQPELSPWHWTLPETRQLMQQAGSKVHVLTLPQMRDRFYYREDANDYEKTISVYLPMWIDHALIALSHETVSFKKAKTLQTQIGKPSKRTKALRPYRGRPALPLALADLQGQHRDIQQRTGRVLLINYWASWCPPCRHEIPSLNRLAAHFRNKAFDIIGVNMAEQPGQVKKFMENTPIDFEVWLDSDGQALKQWKVIAFPTSFLVDKKGRIRYGMIGAIDWTREDVLRKVEQLLME